MAFIYYTTQARHIPMISEDAVRLQAGVQWNNAIPPPVSQAFWDGPVVQADDIAVNDNITVTVQLPDVPEYVWKLAQVSFRVSHPGANNMMPVDILFNPNWNGQSVETNPSGFLAHARTWSTRRNVSNNVSFPVGYIFGTPNSNVLPYHPADQLAVANTGFARQGGCGWSWTAQQPAQNVNTARYTFWPHAVWLGWPFTMRKAGALRIPELYHG